MKTVITYGTYDLLHEGHVRLLERAKALGDYLIVGVTAEAFDKARGKINVEQTLAERMEAIKSLGIADEVIVEEYEGQKIDDVQRYSVDVFTVGSDWIGKFDYLNEYCDVVYLDRTEGISSTDLRAQKKPIRLGFVGDAAWIEKYFIESSFVNGLVISGLCSKNELLREKLAEQGINTFFAFEELLEESDAVFLATEPCTHYDFAKKAIECGKHVLCESPIAKTAHGCSELIELAKKNHVVLVDAIKTAYSTAYSRMLLLAKSGRIGKIVSIESTCTSLRNASVPLAQQWSSMAEWGPIAMLPIMQLLGSDWNEHRFITALSSEDNNLDVFTEGILTYADAVATFRVGSSVKAEGDLVISGTTGYIYVPAPWWKTDYFEIRREDPAKTQRYFYQLEGEGIRYELVAFVRAARGIKGTSYISGEESIGISRLLESFDSKDNTIFIASL